jgi:hypothetical protein
VQKGAKTMFTSLLVDFRKMFESLQDSLAKIKPENWVQEEAKDSKTFLLKLYISEINREIESNRKRSERTKRCMMRKLMEKNE